MGKEKKSGRLLMAAGVLFLIIAMGLTGYNLWDETRAETSAQTILSVVASQLPEVRELDFDTLEPEDMPAYKLFPEMEMPTTTVDDERYIGTLDIPVLGLSLPIMSDWNYSNLRIAPCRFSGSAYTNDLVLCGHNYRTHFGPIRRLMSGDELLFTDMDGNLFRYEVVQTEVLEPTAVEEMLEDGWDLTLFTCTYGGQTRLTVRCMLVED